MRPRKQEPVKYCVNCNCRVTRKRFGKRLEDFGAFLRRKHCSQSCANSRKEKTADGWRRKARQHGKNASEACGAKSKLHVHHCDHDVTNNDPANLQTLCASCHIKHHHSSQRSGEQISGRLELPA